MDCWKVLAERNSLHDWIDQAGPDLANAKRHNKVPGYPLGGWVRSSFAILLVPLCKRTPNTAKSSAA